MSALAWTGLAVLLVALALALLLVVDRAVCIVDAYPSRKAPPRAPSDWERRLMRGERL